MDRNRWEFNGAAGQPCDWRNLRFQLPKVNPASIISTTWYNVLPSQEFDLAANGTENGQTNATFIVFDKARRFIVHGNTTPGSPVDSYKQFPVYIKFMENGAPGEGRTNRAPFCSRESFLTFNSHEIYVYLNIC